MPLTRMGDGSLVELTLDQIKRDLIEGSEDAADRGKIPPLTESELERLAEIICYPRKFISVERGNELVLTFDGGTLKMLRLGIPIGRPQIIQTHERAFGSDTMELAHIDYSYKAIKPIVAEERAELEQALQMTVLPLFYGAMPNLGLYSQPDGPVPNPAELLPAGKILEAQAAIEQSVEFAVKDMVYVADSLYEGGADGINFDTTGASGDGDFLATLIAVKKLKEKHPNMCIELGMAGEFVLGMHGQMTFEGTRLAGLYPHQQVKLAEQAGASIFGAVVNTKSDKSLPWNIARSVTFMKACVEAANIPVHANVGMGVGGVPVSNTPQVDAVCRVSTAMAEIGRLDGLQVGVGDPFGMAISHALASGMGGMRTAGDLVARMQMSRGMRLSDAKKYVAGKLGVKVEELTDETIMEEIREDLNIGSVHAIAGRAKGMEAKFRIAELLDIEINSVNRFIGRSR